MSDEFFSQSFSPVRGPSSKNAASSASGTLRSRKPPPPPPPPARSSVTSTGTGTGSGGSAGVSSQPISSSSSSSGGYYGSGGVTKANRTANVNRTRPTGNYYATTATSSAATTSSSAAFPAYNPYGSAGSGSGSGDYTTATGSGSGSSNAAPNPYGSASGGSSYYTATAASNVGNSGNANDGGMNSNTNLNTNTNLQQPESDDWFSAAQNDTHNLSFSSSSAAPTGTGTGGTASSGTTASAAPTYMNPYAPTNTNTSTSTHADSDNPAFSGTMSSTSTTPSSSSSPSSNYTSPMIDYENEPPLLEELGINISHIRTKSLAVILPFKYAKSNIDSSIMEDNDLAGPLVFGLALGTELTLAGRIQYSYIYGFGLFGTMATTLVLNLMSPSGSISVWKVLSVLGYSLLPVNILAAINVFYRIRYMGSIGVVLAALTIGWCTLSSTRLVERGCGMRDQRYLVGYPNMLLYSAFVMLTIF